MTLNFHIGAAGKLLTPKEAAARLKMSVKTLFKLTDQGRIACVDRGTAKRKLRSYSIQALDDFASPKKLTGKPPCLFLSVPALKLTAMTSGLKAVDFLAIPKPAQKKPPKP